MFYIRIPKTVVNIGAKKQQNEHVILPNVLCVFLSSLAIHSSFLRSISYSVGIEDETLLICSIYFCKRKCYYELLYS